MERKQFTFYRSFYDAVMKLPKSMRYRLLMAIVEFGLDRREPVGLTATQEGLFILVRPVLVASWKRAVSGMAGGKTSRRGPVEKISKIENEDEIEKEKETESEGFRVFWQRYPVKLGRQEALAQWERVCGDAQDILSGLDNWLQSESWRRENGRFVPKPEKWLRERWWEQSPKQAIPMGASGKLGQAEMEAIAQLFED